MCCCLICRIITTFFLKYLLAINDLAIIKLKKIEERIIDVKAGRYSNRNIYYDFVDDKPLQGNSYYRLKQVDFDSKFEYSKIINVNFTNNNKDIVIYPNPF